jgi:hypothetical protein
MYSRSIIFVWTLTVSLFSAIASGREVDGDAVARIAKVLPKGWKVGLTTYRNDCIIHIETNVIDTVPSHYSDGEGDRKEAVRIEFQILPKYSAAMLKRIEDYNRPFIARLKSAGYDPERRDSIKRKMIPFPMYQDNQYSYVILPPSQVPKNDADFKVLRSFLQSVTSDWTAIDNDVTPVKNIPAFYTYK